MVCVIFGPLVDRLCHKAYLINMSCPSYRVLETKKLNEKSVFIYRLSLSLMRTSLVYF